MFDVLAAAHHLELDEVKEFCFEFLESCLAPDNCITILITAKQYKNFTLRDKVYKHISDNYETITKTQAFLNLENEELFFIVFNLKTRFYVNDEVLCRSLLSWTKQDEEIRKQHFHNRLIKFVNVDRLWAFLIEDLLKESLIQESTDYYKLLNDRIIDLKTKGTKIISIGGLEKKRKGQVVYSLNKETKETFPDLPISLYFHCSIKTDNFVYVIGGRDHDSQMQSNRAFRLNLKEKVLKWEETASMNCRRGAFGVAMFGNTIVASGDYDGSKHLSSAEAYDAMLNQWINIKTLNQCRSGNQSETSSGCLYAIGGWDGKNASSVERLDELDQFWKLVSSMETPRSLFVALSCNDVIYAIGGSNDGFNVLKSVEKYDCVADKWIYVSDMNIERYGHSACVFRHKIFVVGGRNAEYMPVQEIECYDPSTDKWEIISKVDDKLFAHSLVVV